MLYDKPEGTEGTVDDMPDTFVDIIVASPDYHDEQHDAKNEAKDKANRKRKKLTFAALIAVVLAIVFIVVIVVARQKKGDNSQVGVDQAKDSVAASSNNDQSGTKKECPQEIKICSDMTIVTRVGKNCEFADCPKGACFIDFTRCADGTKVGRDPDNNCEMRTCRKPEPHQADIEQEEEDEATTQCPSRDIGICTDKSTVLRTGPDCEFADCPLGSCLVDTLMCPDGSAVGRDPENNCEYYPCPKKEEQVGQDEQQQAQGEDGQVKCPREIKMCSDTTMVTRDGPNCEYSPCPAGSCLLDVTECSDGSLVGRDPMNNCEFRSCP